MKRLFILSAAVAALASCSNSEVITEVNEPQVPDKAIAFETFSSNATRAENSKEDIKEGLENHHSNFQVWGYKDVQADYVFNGTEVKYESSVWAYSPIRFWDKAAKFYYFYACAPSTADATTRFKLNKASNDPKQENEYFTLSNVTLKDETLSASTTLTESYKHDNARNIDYMIASQCKIATSSSSQAVQLDFNHILSRLNIGVKKASKTEQDNPFNSAIVTLIELKVNKMKSTGSFDESKTPTSGSLNEGTTVRWDSPSGELCYTGAVDASNGTEVNTSETFFLQSLVIPQNVNYENVQLDGTVTDGTSGTSTRPEQAYLCIKYKIQANALDTEGETFVRYINLAQAFGSSSDVIAFNEGWQNTLHITIDADVISFKPEVYKWDTMHEYNYNAESGNSTQTTNP